MTTEPWCRLCGEPIPVGGTVVWSMLELTKANGRPYTAYRPACADCTAPPAVAELCEAGCGRQVVHTNPRRIAACSYPCWRQLRDTLPPQPPPPRPCEHCGTIITAARTTKRRFCSTACRSAAKRAAQIALGAHLFRVAGFNLPDPLDPMPETMDELHALVVRTIKTEGLPPLPRHLMDGSCER